MQEYCILYHEYLNLSEPSLEIYLLFSWVLSGYSNAITRIIECQRITTAPSPLPRLLFKINLLHKDSKTFTRRVAKLSCILFLKLYCQISGGKFCTVVFVNFSLLAEVSHDETNCVSS